MWLVSFAVSFSERKRNFSRIVLEFRENNGGLDQKATKMEKLYQSQEGLNANKTEHKQKDSSRYFHTMLHALGVVKQDV